MWLDTLNFFYKQSNQCDAYNSFGDDLDLETITIQDDWRKMSPKTVHLLWSKEYDKRVTPLIAKFMLQNPNIIVAAKSSAKKTCLTRSFKKPSIVL